MCVKILIALLMALVTLSMFATNTRTSALPTGRPLLSYTPEPNISIDMYELRGNGFKTKTQCAPGSKKFGCTAFCNNTEPEYGEWCKSGDPIIPYPYPSSTIIVPVQTYYLLDVLQGEMRLEMFPIPVALRAQAIAARSYAWWQYENVELPINNSNSFPEHRHLSMDLHHGRQSPHPFPRLRVALSLAKRFVNHIHRWWRVRL